VSTTLAVVFGAAIAMAGNWLFVRRNPHLAEWWYGIWMVVSVTMSAVMAAGDDWGLAVWFAFCAVIDGISWWNHRKRRKRKRATALLGAKSRARITKLVLRQREAAGDA
jgi:hypothetical protein